MQGNTAGSRSPQPKDHTTGMGAVAQAFKNPGFITCVVLLVCFTAGFQFLTITKEITFKKEPVPLQRDLGLLNKTKLWPYELVHAREIPSGVLDALGTREYLQWYLEDSMVKDEMAPERYVHLFVTYYTDKPDAIPHIPEECYMGGGYQAIGDRLIDVPLPSLGDDVVAQVKALTFEKSDFLNKDNRIVMYTFHTNGVFCPDRSCVRMQIGNPESKHAYFSKVEITFGGPGGKHPSQEVAIKAGTRFLQKVLPILVEDHFPDWESVEATADETASDNEATSAAAGTSIRS